MLGPGRIVVSEPDERKRQLVAQMGADVLLNPLEQDVEAEIVKATAVGADVVIESAGRPETAELAPKLAETRGLRASFGVVSPGIQANIAPYDVFYRELTIRGSFVNPFTHVRAVELLAAKRVDVLPLISHRFALDQFGEAIETAQGRDAIKVLVLPVLD